MLAVISPLGQKIVPLVCFPPAFPLRLVPSAPAEVGKYIFPGGELPTLYLLTEDLGAEG